MKKILSATVLMLALFVTACGTEKNSPADDINTLCKAFLHFDEAALKKVDMTPADYEKQFIAEFTKGFIQSSGINFSGGQITKVNDATVNVFKRTEFKTETISENENKATVKITVSTFEKFDENLVLSKIPANVESMSETEQINAVANALAAALQDLKIAGNSDFTVDCQYNEQAKMWLPVELENFGVTLATKIFTF